RHCRRAPVHYRHHEIRPERRVTVTRRTGGMWAKPRPANPGPRPQSGVGPLILLNWTHIRHHPRWLMRKRLLLSVVASGLATTSTPLGLLAGEPAQEPVALGTRVEMFVDSWLIDANRSPGDVSLQLQPPIKREIVLVTDKPWE